MPRRILLILTALCLLLRSAPCPADELYPKHINAQTQKAIKAGLDHLAKTQSQDGDWNSSPDGIAYPVAMSALAGMAFLAHGDTPSRGPYADNIHRVELYLMSESQPSGLITDVRKGDGGPMHGHGFALMFLATVYGMEDDARTRDQLKKVIQNAIKLTAQAQSQFGGWTYTPGGGDEGSVTVTQIQGLRAASNAGFTVPKGTIEQAVKYLERCKTPEGGIEYSLGSATGPRLPISAAAIATLYNAGQYDSKLADDCLHYVWQQFNPRTGTFSVPDGHSYYTHLYASQAFYQAGDKYWDAYFPTVRDRILGGQQPDGSWNGDIGTVYASSISLIILQLPYKFLPIYQR
jgi:hypothetical protein